MTQSATTEHPLDESSPRSSARRSPAPRAGAAAAPPLPRTPKIAFDEVPKHWFGGSVMATHLVNGINLLFPAGERFFVRAVHRYVADLDDAALAAQVRGFFGQEGRHAQAHERFFETLRAQGYDIDTFLADYERIAYDVIEKYSPPAFRLSVTVALEHFTALLAEDALTTGDLEHAHPVLRSLLEWHAVEELEHKAVAFDVLAKVHPSYALRIAGLAMAVSTLGAFWVVATRELLKQDGMTFRDGLRDLARVRKQAEVAGRGKGPSPIVGRLFGKGILQYLRPSFHPNDRDHSRLVEETLARLTASGVVPA